ncbi:hypothetical protein ACFVTM_03830 [Arthrobacter sp. NPDC058130]|uniref:hypothetical protein n=1 Tax=Arthrobacter sp. NPDC058130 TaxID=3346353 RepID=UPI0036EF780F
MSCSDGRSCTRADALLGVEGIHFSSVAATAASLVLHTETGETSPAATSAAAWP